MDCWTRLFGNHRRLGDAGRRDQHRQEERKEPRRFSRAALPKSSFTTSRSHTFLARTFLSLSDFYPTESLLLGRRENAAQPPNASSQISVSRNGRRVKIDQETQHALGAYLSRALCPPREGTSPWVDRSSKGSPEDDPVAKGGVQRLFSSIAWRTARRIADSVSETIWRSIETAGKLRIERSRACCRSLSIWPATSIS